MKVYWLKHAKVKIENNEFFRCHLSEEGIEKTKELVNSGKLNNPEIIFSSSFNRAKETADIFAEMLNKEVIVDERVSEWKLQSLNSPNFPEEEKKGWENKSEKVEGGESLDEVLERVMGFLKELGKENKYETVLIVSHGVPIELACSKILSRDGNLENVHNTTHLSYAILDVSERKIEVIKDIIDK